MANAASPPTMAALLSDAPPPMGSSRWDLQYSRTTWGMMLTVWPMSISMAGSGVDIRLNAKSWVAYPRPATTPKAPALALLGDVSSDERTAGEALEVVALHPLTGLLSNHVAGTRSTAVTARGTSIRAPKATTETRNGSATDTMLATGTTTDIRHVRIPS